MVLNIHKPDDTTNRLLSCISQHMAIMGYHEIPIRITRVYSREYTNGMPGNFHRMLVAKDMDGLKSNSLDGINKTIANHIDLDRVPLRTERVLRNSHYDSAPRHTFLPILHSIVLGRLGVEE
jgi:hypothetical protein